MRWLLVVVLLAACTPAAAVQPSDDPHPTFVMWNAHTTLLAGEFAAMGLPDTFTSRITFTATRPVRMRIMSLDQFAAFRSARVDDAAVTYPATTTLDVTFHDAEGCARYVLVLDTDQDVVISPNLTITRAPADHLTGTCAN